MKRKKTKRYTIKNVPPNEVVFKYSKVGYVEYYKIMKYIYIIL
jgi:hypothetical protein